MTIQITHLSGRARLPGSTQIADRAAWLGWLDQCTNPDWSAIDGSFAIAYRDHDGSDVLAIDRFAIETLCFCVRDGQLLSSPRADSFGANELQAQALFDYLFLHAIPSDATIFRDVRRLPPGHVARWRNGRLDLAPYWRPVFQEPQEADFATLREEFRALLADATKECLDGSRPACFLSGGTDSSTVAGMIRQVTGDGAHSYSIGFDAEGYDEMAYARIAAQRFGAVAHEYYVTADDLVQGIPAMSVHFDQPFGNSSVLPAYYCAQQAKADGVSMLLAGDGGDELFGGNARYAKQKVFGWWGGVPGNSLLTPVLDNGLMRQLPIFKKAASYVQQANVALPERLQTYNMLSLLGFDEVLTPAFQAQTQLENLFARQRDVWSLAENGGDLNRMLAFDWRFTLAESDIPKVRAATELAGVAVGFPLLNRRLLEFSMKLPVHYKLKGFQLRWFFKEALRDFLPDEIITKKKHGFGLPFGHWALTHQALNTLATDSLRSFASRGVVRESFIDRLLNTHLPAHPGYYGEMVWILMMLEQWLRLRKPDYNVAG